MQLTPEQAGIARACGCQIVPATEEQIWRLPREHRIFRLNGAAVVVRRPDGFLETAGTLRLLLEQHARAQDLAEAAHAMPPAPPLDPPPASSASAPSFPGPESPPSRAAGPERAPRRAPRGESGGMGRDLPFEPPRPESGASGPAPRPRSRPAPTEAAGGFPGGEAGTGDPVPQPGLREAPPDVSPDRPSAMPEAAAGTSGERTGNSAGNPPGGFARPVPGTDAPAPAATPTADSERGEGPLEPRPEPAVPIAESVTPGYLICLEDGRQVKMLTRHLKAAYGMTPDQYRARWGLPPDYPMVAPDSAERRAAARMPRATGRGRAGGVEEGAVEE